MNGTSYFCVAANTSPWDGERILASYTSKDAASRASDFVRNAYLESLKEGIDVRVREYAGKIIATQGGDLRLEDTPRGALTIIKTEFNKKECIRLLNLPFNEELFISSKKRSKPKTISVEDYACVNVKQGDRISTVGYYQTDKLAQKVLFFLSDINRDSDLLFSISSYQGTLVISDSGKKWLETAEKMEEVKARLDFKEYRRLVEIGEKEPIPWGKLSLL